MEFRTKRILSLIVVCSYLFLGGVEFAVIFPTAWEYLQSMGVCEEYLLGVTVSAYSVSAAFAGVIGGRWADRHPDSTKALCIFCIVIMVLGNLLYIVGINVWVVVVSRFICGLGTGAGAALLAYVCRTTTVAERTAKLAVCNACRQIGILIGPAFQIMLTYANFNIGPLLITRLNAAGLFMALLWIVFILICMFMFSDITSEWQAMLAYRQRERRSPRVPRDEQPSLCESRSSFTSTRAMSLCESIVLSPPDAVIGTHKFSQEILRDTVVSLLGTVFTAYFGQILIETILPIYMKGYFGLGDVEISLMYMLGGIECLLLLVLLIFLSRIMPDWTLNLIGFLFILSGFTWLCVTLPYYEPGDMSNLVPFIIINVVIGAGYPMTNVANTSLLSKCLSVETQGIGQGLRRFMSYLGLVLGPMWAGAAAKYPAVLGGVALGLVMLHLALYLDALPRLIKVERSVRSQSQGEETPLVDPTRRFSAQSWSSTSGGFTFVETKQPCRCQVDPTLRPTRPSNVTHPS